jgi:hypothetical protein
MGGGELVKNVSREFDNVLGSDVLTNTDKNNLISAFT